MSKPIPLSTRTAIAAALSAEAKKIRERRDPWDYDENAMPWDKDAFRAWCNELADQVDAVARKALEEQAGVPSTGGPS